MSSLRSLDLNVIDDLVDFIHGAGYVLTFSNVTFAEFFATELDVDIDDARYAEMGTSKGKRLRRFLQLVDDKTALKTLQALWEHRVDYLQRASRTDPVANAEARYLAIVNRLGGGPAAATPQEPPKAAFDLARAAALKAQVIELSSLAPHPRGYAFEKFLGTLFETYGLKPREPFRNRGEQIDGSFMLGHDTYLLEAKWQQAAIGAAELHVFEGKLSQKAAWARGLFISYSGFTEEGLDAFGRGGKRMICMDGFDLYEMLDKNLPFDHVVDRKARRAVETGLPFIRVRDLF